MTAMRNHVWSKMPGSLFGTATGPADAEADGSASVMRVAVVSVIGWSPTSAATVSSTVPASTPAGTSLVTESWAATVRAADSKAAVRASELVAVTTLPLPALAKAASDFSWLPSPSDTASRTTPESARTWRACLPDASLSASFPSESRTMFRLPSAPSC